MRTKVTTTELLEFVEEYSSRFPDEYNSTVIDAAEEYYGRKLNCYERCVMVVCYDHGYDAAIKESKVWGVFQ